MKYRLLIIVIVLVGGVLRLLDLSSYPALNADEAALGYNAYSLLETGRDEHGNPWPIYFQSFNDWKPGLYVYTIMPFVKIMGLNEIAVRLPGALFGIGTIILLYFLIKEIWPKDKWLPVISSLFLAISPWHLHYSRGGWEVNVATFFITLGVLMFLKGRESGKWWYISLLTFVAALYTYHAARIVSPLLILSLAFIYKELLRIRIKTIIKLAVFGCLLVLPLLFSLLGPAGLSRATGVGLFADTGPYWKTNEQRGEHRDPTLIETKLLHNKLVNYGLAFLQNYSSHFNPEFLFISGDKIERNKVPEMGQMYLLDSLFLLAGLVAISRRPKGWLVILAWLLIAPIASSLTFQSPHALRSQNMIIPLVVISASGFLNIVKLSANILKSRALIFIFLVILSGGYMWDFSRYIHEYYIYMAKTYDNSSQYGVKELAKYTQDNYDRYSKFVITTQYDQPYILMLFYLQYPPQKFQKEHTLTSRDQYGFSTVPGFDKFSFKPINPLDEIKREYPGALLAGSDGEIPIGANVIKKIYFPSGRIAFELVDN